MLCIRWYHKLSRRMGRALYPGGGIPHDLKLTELEVVLPNRFWKGVLWPEIGAITLQLPRICELTNEIFVYLIFRI